MKIRNITIGIFIIFILGCFKKAENPDPNIVLEIEKEIEKLKTNDDKKAFLEKVLKDDQKVRDGSDAAIIQEFGYDSKEHLEHTKIMWKQDEINVIKIEKYLEKFPYPKKTELGDDAAMAPWLVIHHSSNIGLRNKYFEILYQAYLDQNIDDGGFSLYLGRTYDFTFGERLKMKNPFRPEDEINALIKALGLEERKEKIIK